MLTIPPEWTVCPQCGGKCLCVSRGLVGIEKRVAMRIVMECRMCRTRVTHDDSELEVIQ